MVRTKISTTCSVTSMYGITNSPQFEMSQNVARLPVPQNEIEFVTQNMSFAGKDIFCNNAKDGRTISHKLRYLKLWPSLFANVEVSSLFQYL